MAGRPRQVLAGLRAASLAALVAVVPDAAAANAPVPTFRVVGQCREGQPQGTYGLRSGDNTTRVIGAFNHGKRTGSFIFWNDAGVRIAHVPFDEDVVTGTLALWYPGPLRNGATPQKLEAGYAAGRRNGPTRSWHPNGRLRTELEYRDGTLVEAKAWDAEGRPLDADAARALATRDERADRDALRSLDRLVAEHRPDCGGEAPSGTRA